MPWVTISVVAGFSVQIRSSSTLSRCRVMSSSAPKGSSSRSTDGRTTRARAMETRCRMPPDSWAGLAFSNPSSPTSRTSSATSSRSPGRPATSRGSAMLSTTERHGSSAASWKAMPSWCSRRSSAGVRPSTSAEPLVGSSSPARIRRTVDLPHPDGPRRERKLPRSVCRVTSSSAWTSVRPARKTLPRSVTRTPVPVPVRPGPTRSSAGLRTTAPRARAAPPAARSAA